VKIHYPFHPLNGQNLRVQRRAKFPRGEYIYCELPDGTIGGVSIVDGGSDAGSKLHEWIAVGVGGVIGRSLGISEQLAFRVPSR
jgi:hypothetical protein